MQYNFLINTYKFLVKFPIKKKFFQNGDFILLNLSAECDHGAHGNL